MTATSATRAVLIENVSLLGEETGSLLIVDGLFLVSAFRLRGAELAPLSLERTLPIDRAAARLGRWLATLLHPLWAAAIAGVAVLTTGALAAAVIVLALGVGLALVVTALTHVLADIDARLAWPWRAGVVALVGLIGGWL